MSIFQINIYYDNVCYHSSKQTSLVLVKMNKSYLKSLFFLFYNSKLGLGKLLKLKHTQQSILSRDARIEKQGPELTEKYV